MKPSEIFSSMEEVKKYCESFKDRCTEEQYNALKHVLGLAEQEGVSEFVEGIGEIDVSIAKFVRDLNAVGLTTLASCSGLLKDHPTKKEVGSGYIAFRDMPFTTPLVKAAAEELFLPCEEGEAYLKPCVTVRFEKATDAEKELDWEQFVDRLLQIVSSK